MKKQLLRFTFVSLILILIISCNDVTHQQIKKPNAFKCNQSLDSVNLMKIDTSGFYSDSINTLTDTSKYYFYATEAFGNYYDNLKFEVKPNPFRSKININIYSGISNDVYVRLYDSDGTMLYNAPFSLQTGWLIHYINFNLPMNKLKDCYKVVFSGNGIYFGFYIKKAKKNND